MSYSFKIFLRSDFLRKDGLTPIYLRVIIDRKKKDHSLNMAIPEGLWDTKNNKVKKSLRYNSEDLNSVLSKTRMKVEKIMLDSKLGDKRLTMADFDRLYSQKSIDYSSFYEYALGFIEQNRHKFSSETCRTYTSQVTKLKRFRTELRFADMDIDFLRQYDVFMVSKLNNQTNTHYKSMAFIKTVWFQAMRDGMVSESIFKNFPLKKKLGNRSFLDMEDLKSLEALLNADIKGHQRNVLKYFLFACYTGLRFLDIKNLMHSHLVEGDMLQIEMHKTKDVVRVPLIDRAKGLIETGFENQPVFHVATNQVTNRYLKELMVLAKIKKSISFHCARHTFATCSIDLGMPLEVISKLLGHKDLKTTQIYAKILDSVKVKEMGKWN
ncbi:MAG: site-specific integrase [Bacteroidota bacterium]